MEFTLLVPGLLAPMVGVRDRRSGALLRESLNLEALDLLLTRSRRVPDPVVEESLEGMMLGHAGLACPAGADWPVAAITRALDARAAPPGNWTIRADPVHLRADLSDASLDAAGAFPLSAVEAEAIVGAINEHFSAEAWRLVAWHPHRWYIEGAVHRDLRTVPLSLVSGAMVDARRARGPHARYWARIVNEMQMLLHSSPVNRERVARGEVPVNSLWLWGGGAPPPVWHSRWRALCTDHVLGHALGAYLDVEWRALPARADALGGMQGEVLLILDALYGPSRRNDFETWCRGLNALSRDWFESLLRMLTRGEVERLTICPGGGVRFSCTRRSVRRWWRRPKPFETLG